MFIKINGCGRLICRCGLNINECPGLKFPEVGNYDVCMLIVIEYSVQFIWFLHLVYHCTFYLSLVISSTLLVMHMYTAIILNHSNNRWVHTVATSLVTLPALFFPQLQRVPRKFPTLAFARQVTNIDDFTFEDFVLTGYKPHPKIAMDMAL